MPSPRKMTSSYFYGYPIFETASCYGSKIELRCARNQFIHIYSAYYGNQANTNYCNNELDIICFRSTSFNYIIENCENRTFCSILVTERVFGNPCLDLVSNQIMIQYQCIDTGSFNLVDESCSDRKKIPSNCPSLQHSNQSEKFWCEPDTMRIECPNGQLINILCAFYGLDPNIKCKSTANSKDMPPTSCFSKSSMEMVKSQCNNQESCEFAGEISFEMDSGFVNPCPGYQNMLFVQWECLSMDATSSSIDLTTTKSVEKTTLGALAATSMNVTCDLEPEFSTYEPKFITTSALTYFGYPIYQQLVCQGSRLILVCPSDLVIHVLAGYYGIQSATRSSTCTSSNVEIPAKCYIPDAFEVINGTCEAKTTCQLKATSNALTNGEDFCPSYQKQLFIQYQCVNEQVLSTSIGKCSSGAKRVPGICKRPATNDTLEATWCDGATMSIVCPSSRTISIQCAFYGIHPSVDACNVQSLPSKPVCYYASSLPILRSICDDQPSCSLDSFSLTFNRDPCSGHEKALYVQWRCI